jgi:hypothetical protein
MPQNHKHFGINIYKLFDKTDYTYDIEVYLGRDRTQVTTDMTATHCNKALNKKRYMDMDISCAWTASFPLLTYKMI